MHYRHHRKGRLADTLLYNSFLPDAVAFFVRERVNRLPLVESKHTRKAHAQPSRPMCRERCLRTRAIYIVLPSALYLGPLPHCALDAGVFLGNAHPD